MPSAAAWEKITDLVPLIGVLKGARPDIIETVHEPEQLVLALVEATSFANAAFTPEDVKYLLSFPMGVQEAIRGAVCYVLDSDKKLSLQYEPGYAFSVMITQWGEHDDIVNIRVTGPNASYFDLAGPLAADTPRA